MPDSGQLGTSDQFCQDCRSGTNLPRYAGLLRQCAEELIRETGRRMDGAAGGALDGRWRSLLAARCGRCGAYLAQQWMDAEELSIKSLSEPDDLRRFPNLAVLDPYFLATADQQTLLGGMVEAALDHSSADMGNVQLFEPTQRGLFIAAQLGFDKHFLDFFEWVRDDGSACATAATQRASVVVPDVARSPLFTDASRQVMLDAGANAVQSIPLASSTGYLLGIFSCHYHKAGIPSDDDVPLLGALTRAAVRFLQWQARKVGNGHVVTAEADGCLEGGGERGNPPGSSQHLVEEIRKIVTEVHRLLDDPS